MLFLRYLMAVIMLIPNLLGCVFGDYAYPAVSREGAYLFCYFVGNETEQQRIHLAVSKDGYNFEALNSNQPVIIQENGKKCVRDPYIFKAQDGTYYIIGTDMNALEGWTSNHALVTWHSEDLINWTDEAIIDIRELGGGLFIGQFVIMGFVPRLLEKTTKKKLYNGSKIISVLPQLAIFFLFLAFPHRLAEPVFLIITMLIFAVCGIAMGLNSVLQTLMISDAVDYEEYHYGIRPDGVFFSGQTFLVKIGSGFASIIYGITCELVHYTGDNIKRLNEFIQQGNIIRDFLDRSAPNFSEEYFGYMAMLFFCISVPPAIGALLSVIPTWKYALDDDEHTRILEELNRRRREEETK